MKKESVQTFGLILSLLIAFMIGCASAPELQKESVPAFPDISTQNKQPADASKGGFENKSSKHKENQPTIVEKEEIRLLGVLGTEGMEGEGEYLADYVLLKLFFPNMHKLEKFRKGEGLYGIYHEGYMFAVPTTLTSVPKDVGLPKETICRTTLKGTYAVFITTARALGNKADEMVNTWFTGQKEYVKKTNVFAVEYYPPDNFGADSPMELWIPVEKR